MTTAQRILIIAAISGADPRTVAKQMQGKPAHGAVLRQRIEEAMKKVENGAVRFVVEGDASVLNPSS